MLFMLIANNETERVKSTVLSLWHYSGLPFLVQLLTWLHVSEYRNFWNTERW